MARFWIRLWFHDQKNVSVIKKFIKPQVKAIQALGFKEGVTEKLQKHKQPFADFLQNRCF